MSHDSTTKNKTIAAAARYGLAATAGAVVWMCLAADVSAQQPFEDDHNQMSFSVTGGAQNVNVHVCPGNALLIGVDLANNRFLCQPVAEPLGPLSVDTSTRARGFNAHACPEYEAMVGLSVDKNWLICTHLLPPPGWVGGAQLFGDQTLDADPGTQVPEPTYPKRNMHACTANYTGVYSLALAGIKADQNILVCMDTYMLSCSLSPAPPGCPTK
jgi:hypothetical protein